MKGQVINIDYTIALGLFLISTLSTALIMTDTNVSFSNSNAEFQEMVSDVSSDIERTAYTTGKRSAFMKKTPHNVKNVPIDRNYIFTDSAYPGSGSMDVPAEVDVFENRIVTIVNLVNGSNSLAYFTEDTLNITYQNNISTEGDSISNSHLSLSTSNNGLSSLKISGNEVLESTADLGSDDSSIVEHELYAETLNGDLKVYNNSPEIIVETDGVFNLKNFTEIYWSGNGTENLEPGDTYSGETPGLALSSVDGENKEYGIAFMGDEMDAEVSKQSGTVEATINSPRTRIRLFDTGIDSGRKRVQAHKQGDMFFGPSKQIKGVSWESLERLNNMPEEEFEDQLGLENLGYNITLRPRKNTLVTEIEKKVGSQPEWNSGSFEGTSSDRDRGSGDLGIGYRNGTATDNLVGYWRMDTENLLENPGFESDEIGETSPSQWEYPDSDGWNVTDSYTAPGSEGEKSFGNPWQQGPGVWPDAYIYNNRSIEGGEEYVAESWIRLQSYSDGNWDGTRSDQQYIYEDDARLHLYFYDGSGNLLNEEKTRWIGDAYNRNLSYVEKNGDWFKLTRTYTAPNDAEYVRFQIDGGDNNNDYGDPETAHGGNAGIWMDDTSLTRKKVKDYSGMSNDGTKNNEVEPDTEGILGTSAFRFHGSEDKPSFIEVSTEESEELVFDNESSFTFSAWIKPVDGGTDRTTYYVGRGHTAHSYGLHYNPNPNLGVNVRDGDGNSETLSEAVEMNQWYHTAMVYNPNNLSFYINGELSDSVNPDTNNFSTSRDQLIGGDGRPGGTNSGSPGFQEKLDEIRIYNESLPQEKIQQLYFQGRDEVFSGNYTSEISNSRKTYWHTLEINASVPKDTSLNTTFESLTDSGTVSDSQTVSIEDGLKNYSLNVESSQNGRMRFEGNTKNITKSWEIENFSVHSSNGRNEAVSRGSKLPVTQNVIIANLGSTLIDRSGKVALLENRVALWR